ncbi:MAG: GNAT family N-acetyltransferase [Tannerellaceae bacterium]|nr:GNAT family N-acetyltransferase [Tannerellaceae bacterium]
MTSDITIQVNDDIQLTPPTLADAEAIFHALHTNRESLRAWLPFVDYTKTVEDSKAFLENVPDSGEILFKINYRNHFAGLIGLKAPDTANHKVEIGYWITAEMEGKGIVTQSCRALITYAFEVLDMNRALIQVAAGNRKSRNIPERLGFTQEGIERDGELLVSGFTDIVRYGLLKREYNANN